MRYSEIIETAGVGKIVKGVNTTRDVRPDELTKQAKKLLIKVDKNGIPPSHWDGIKIACRKNKLAEGRDAALYHATTWNNIIKILNDPGDRLTGKSKQIIDNKEIYGTSLTRNLAFALEWGPVVLQLNQSKLVQTKKLVPVNWHETNRWNNPTFEPFNDIHSGRSKGINQFEEFVIGDIPNLRALTDKIYIKNKHPVDWVTTVDKNQIIKMLEDKFEVVII